MKTLREHNFFGPVQAGDSYWLQEPVWIGSNGERRITKAGLPAGRPSWLPGHYVVLYVGGRQQTAALVKVVKHPAPSGPDDWPWCTRAKVIGVDGPSLGDLGVTLEMVMRRVRWRLEADQAQRALSGFGAEFES